MATSPSLAPAAARFSIPQSRLSRNGKELRADVRHALDRGENRILVDCEGWSEFDLPTLSSLVHCASACRTSGASFEVSNLSGKIMADVRALRLGERLGLQD